MLIIRDAQMDALAEATWRNFERRAFRYLRDVIPDQCAAFGEVAVRESVLTAIRKARAYGLVEEYDVLRYLNLMYALDFAFDTHPSYPWAGRILSRSDLAPRERMDQLTEIAIALEQLPPSEDGGNETGLEEGPPDDTIGRSGEGAG